MKIKCDCGEDISDVTDGLSYKAHFLPDQFEGQLWTNLEAVLEKAHDRRLDLEKLYMELRSCFGGHRRTAWQCRNCGNLYIDDEKNELKKFLAHSHRGHSSIFDFRDSIES